MRRAAAPPLARAADPPLCPRTCAGDPGNVVASVRAAGALFFQYLPDRLFFDGFPGDRVDPMLCLGDSVSEPRG